MRRRRLRYTRVSGRWIGAAIVAVGWAMLHFGYGRHMDGVWHFGALLVVIGSVVSVLGGQILSAFGPAVLVLAFCSPGAPGHPPGDLASVSRMVGAYGADRFANVRRRARCNRAIR